MPRGAWGLCPLLPSVFLLSFPVSGSYFRRAITRMVNSGWSGSSVLRARTSL